jgi:hypothetical protein
MHQAIGLGLLIYLIAFAFGERAARTVVGIALVIGALAFAYVMLRLVEGTI